MQAAVSSWLRFEQSVLTLYGNLESALKVARKLHGDYQAYIFFGSLEDAGYPYPRGLSRYPGARTYMRLVTAGWSNPSEQRARTGLGQFVSDAQSVWPAQDGVSAPETRAGRMATSARMTLGQESMASDAESYHRSL